MSVDSQDSEPLPDLRYIRELAQIIKQHGLSEIEIEAGEQRLLLRRNETGSPPFVTAKQNADEQASPKPSSSKQSSLSSFITSPFAGTFYQAAKPSLPPFVKIGQRVTEGQPLCLIEAMKLFNEIEADFACTIEEALVENGQTVDLGTNLFRVSRA